MTYSLINKYVAVIYDVSTAAIMADKEIFDIVHNANYTIYVDSDENSDSGINDAVFESYTPEMEKFIKICIII